MVLILSTPVDRQMTERTRKEWLKVILDGSVEHRFAGTRLVRPKPGDKVRVVSGTDVGMEFQVVLVEGNAYRSDNQVYVDHPSGVPTWYYPWNLEVIEAAT